MSRALVQQQYRILIIDDNLNNQVLLFEYLNSAGFEVVQALDGASGIEQVNLQVPDLILLDVMMPEIDGFEICAYLKSNQNYAEIPIIFITALADSEHKVKGFNLGAVDYITKPFDYNEILVRVNLHLKLSTLNQQLKQEVEEKRKAEMALQYLNQELEQRVTQRTIELKTALKELQHAQKKLLEREQQLEYEAYHDTLTTLPNRAWCIKRLNSMIQIAKSDPNYLYAVLFLDLDRFKVVNDSLGHFMGDELLKKVAQRLQSCLTPKSHIARLGGDEFVVLLEGIEDMSAAVTLASIILEELNQPFQLNHYEIYSGCSIGITISSVGYEKPEEVLRDADAAMYRAKLNGRGCYEVLTSELQQFAVSRLQLENDLRRAISQEEFSLCYQPIVPVSGSEGLGFEALIRWHHPKRGLISPAEFIPVAEETGLISEIGWLVLKEALNQAHAWKKQFSSYPPITINVNVSAQQLMQVNFVKSVENLFFEFGVSTDYIKFEITESCLLKAASQEAETLKQLRALGIQLCIDDFGTGYSSLSRLHEFPINTLKIDRSFVNRIGLNNGEIELIQAIIALAHGLGLDVVAEGIETKAQFNQLCLMGCEWGQGYFMSKPLDALRATQYIVSTLAPRFPHPPLEVAQVSH